MGSGCSRDHKAFFKKFQQDLKRIHNLPVTNLPELWYNSPCEDILFNNGDKRVQYNFGPNTQLYDILDFMGIFKGLNRKDDPPIMISVVLGGTRSQFLHRDPRDFVIMPLVGTLKLWIARNDLGKNERNEENDKGYVRFPHLR